MTDHDLSDDLPAFIPGIAAEHVAEVADPQTRNIDARLLLDAETEYVRRWRGQGVERDEEMPFSGLAFSGGGVRSAAFALGVLQVLAGRRFLERFDYVSSVSGGGFASGALIWFLGPSVSGRFGSGPADFPFGAEPRSRAPSVTGAAGESDSDDTSVSSRTDGEVTESRSEAPEASAGAGMKADASTETDPASALLNFLRQHGTYLTPGHGITLVSAVAVVLRGILLNLIVWIPILVAVMFALLVASNIGGREVVTDKGVPAAFDLVLWIAIGFGLLFLICCLVYSISTHPRWSVHKRRYLLHRLYETHSPWLLLPMLAAATLASLPWAADVSLGFIGQFGGAAFVAIGLGVGLWSFLRPDDSWGVSFVRQRALPFGALLALYGVLLFAYQSARWIYVDGSITARAIALLLLVVALLSGWAVNLNYISVQRFYRDRLMEAFMPDLGRALRREGGASPEADEQRLSACLDRARSDGPYPLFNTHLPLASAESRRRRLRGGDNFVLSPLYCGSSATGWRRTDAFMEDSMTLPTAMAISGSVNHQQSGLGGVGTALNPLVSLLKVLLNLRMGYWVPNPRAADQSRRPNHFVPGLGEALGIGREEKGTFLLLEDGGYFDNLGVYELFRRRLRLVLVCDAGADASARLSDLYRALRLVEVDFGARVTFEDDDYLAVIPREPALYPEGGKVAERSWLLGHIDYADGSTGTLVYLKSALVPGLRFNELGFGSCRANFPQESTVDQFFDEEQFDAHRRLGGELARRMIDEVDLGSRLRRADADGASG